MGCLGGHSVAQHTPELSEKSPKRCESKDRISTVASARWDQRIGMSAVGSADLMEPGDGRSLPGPPERFEVGVDVRTEQITQLVPNGFEIGR